MNSRISISIHAPREGGDGLCGQSSKVLQDFNPRPPRGGRRHATRTVEHHGHFNPRPPRGGRPRHVEIVRHRLQYFNPRPPRGGRLPELLRGVFGRVHFNPRPPRGGRRFPVGWPCSSILFQSTPPARGATTDPRQAVTGMDISIHAPREGGDGRAASQAWRSSHFNPRPPRGGRQQRCTVLPADL